MGVDVEWYQGRKDIIRYIYNGQWTWDDLWRAFEQGNKMMDSVKPQTVHIFIDMTKSGMLPQRPWDMGQRMNEAARSNEGIRIVIGANTFVRMAQETMFKVIELSGKASSVRKSRMVATLKEAEKIIEQDGNRI